MVKLSILRYQVFYELFQPPKTFIALLFNFWNFFYLIFRCPLLYYYFWFSYIILFHNMLYSWFPFYRLFSSYMIHFDITLCLHVLHMCFSFLNFIIFCWWIVPKRLLLQPWLKLLFIFRYTMERPRFSDHLEAIKFICKDFWSELFKKQIDNLKTNHRVMQRIPHAWFFSFLLENSDFLDYCVCRVPLSFKITVSGGLLVFL